MGDEKKKERDWIIVSLSRCNSQIWTKLKPEGWNNIWVSYVGARTKALEPSSSVSLML